MISDGDWRPAAGKTALWSLGFSDYAPTCAIDELTKDGVAV